MHLPDAAVGPILAAIVGGIVVFVSAVLTKENKTSEFRQEWIDELRSDLAEFISGTTELLAGARAKGGDEAKDFLFGNFAVVHKIELLEHRIVLRLNAKEHVKLINLVREFRLKILQAYSAADRDTRRMLEQTLTNAILDESQRILKEEWERVKKGERTFQFTKWGALGAAILFLVWGLSLILTSPKEEKPSDSPKPSEVSCPAEANVPPQSQLVEVVVGGTSVQTAPTSPGVHKPATNPRPPTACAQTAPPQVAN
ncbi:MAG: hypothetical protein ACXWC4_06425 [Telluria sp.]